MHCRRGSAPPTLKKKVNVQQPIHSCSHWTEEDVRRRVDPTINISSQSSDVNEEKEREQEEEMDSDEVEENMEENTDEAMESHGDYDELKKKCVSFNICIPISSCKQ